MKKRSTLLLIMCITYIAHGVNSTNDIRQPIPQGFAPISTVNGSLAREAQLLSQTAPQLQPLLASSPISPSPASPASPTAEQLGVQIAYLTAMNAHGTPASSPAPE